MVPSEQAWAIAEGLGLESPIRSTKTKESIRERRSTDVEVVLAPTRADGETLSGTQGGFSVIRCDHGYPGNVPFRNRLRHRLEEFGRNDEETRYRLSERMTVSAIGNLATLAGPNESFPTPLTDSNPKDRPPTCGL